MPSVQRSRGIGDRRVLHELNRSSFLRPRERLYELITLYRAEASDGLRLESGPEAMLDQRTVAGFVADLEGRALITQEEGEAGRYRLTSAGRRRLHLLMVDFERELTGLHDAARELLRRTFVPLALSGVRRVAFYPFGETAEAAYAAMEGLGFYLVGIVDDSEVKQGLLFHGLRVEAPSALSALAPEAVIVTTAVFQDRILARLAELPLAGVRVHTL